MLAGGCAPGGAAGWRYRFTSNYDASITLSKLKVANQVKDIALLSHFEGEVDVTPTSDPNALIGQMRLFQAWTKVNGQEKTLPLGDLSKPFEVDMDAEGKLLGCHFDPAVSSPARQILASLVSQFQRIELPVASAGKTFLSAEATPSGELNFSYSPLPSSPNEPSFQKIVSPGKPIQTALGEQAARANLKADYRKIDDKLVLIGLSGKTSLDTTAEGSSVSHSGDVLSLSLSTEPPPKELTEQAPALFAKLRKSESVEIDAKPSSEASNNSLQRKELGSTTEAQLLESLKPYEKGTGQAPTDLYLKVVAELTVQPESTGRFAEELHRSEENAANVELISQALVAVGNGPCQAALVQVVKDAVGSERRANRLLGVAAQLKNPDQPTTDAFFAFANSSPSKLNRHLAELVLGAFDHSLQTADPKRGEALDLALYARFDQSPNREEKLTLLASLGNAGTKRAMDAAMIALKSPDELLRAQAVASLRRVPVSLVDSLLIHELQTDDSSQVRSQSVFALSTRQLSKADVENLLDSLHDSDSGVRSRVLDLVWAHRTEDPRIIFEVKRVAKSDPSSAVKSQAKKLLTAK